MESNAAECLRCRRGRESFVYWWDVFEFDVDLARSIVADGRDTVEVEDESVQASVEECEIDVDHVAHVDPTIPGIIAHLHLADDAGNVHRGHVLIDGHHRAARYLREGLPFYAYLLSPEESERVLLRSPEPLNGDGAGSP